MERHPKHPQNHDRLNPQSQKHLSPSPVLTHGHNQNQLTAQMQNLKLNNSEQNVQRDKNDNDDSERYEQNDEAFIEYSTLDEPNTFNKSYSNVNILGDLDDEKYGKKNRAESDVDILGQLDYLLESNMPSQQDIDLRGNDGGFGDKNDDIDKFTEELMMESIDRSIMYEPMVDVKKMTQSYMKKIKDQMNTLNMKTLTLIEKIIDMLHRNECRTSTEKKKILGLFDDIQANGGLPKSVEREAVKKYPDMIMFIAPKNEKEYVIF